MHSPVSYRILVLAVIILSGGCVSKQIGYFEVAPYTRIKADKINQPLYLKLSNRIPDHFSVKSPGIELKVSAFRMSLMHACKKAFADVFTETRMYIPDDKGFILEIQQFDPMWVYDEQTQSSADSGFVQVFCQITYGCTLYLDGTFISQSSGSIKLKYGDEGAYTVESLFMQTVKSAVAQMSEKLYSK